jgi:hypothetical protein
VCSRLELFFYCRAVFDQRPPGFEQIESVLFGNRSFFSSATLRAVPESGFRPWFSRALQQISEYFKQELAATRFGSAGGSFRTIFVFDVEGEEDLTTT